MDTIVYKGERLVHKDNDLGMDVYRPSPELIEAVNLALLLKQPLLLMGEPGCGKTRLAEAVAAELHGQKYKEHFYRWDIKSTSRAKDGIYQYDALKRMYDANIKNEDAADVAKYVTYGKFAKAITGPQNGNLPNILLIDEIDKADIDFPNDLLLEIEKNEFEIPELQNGKVEKKTDVIVFITSNRERELPPAFLRRCLYFYINFPAQQELVSIANAKFGTDTHPYVENAIHLFLDLRSRIETQFAESDKKPSTSELLEWLKAIRHYSALEEAAIPANIKLQLDAVKNYEKNTIDKISVPFQQVLLKTWESGQLFEKK